MNLSVDYQTVRSLSFFTQPLFSTFSHFVFVKKKRKKSGKAKKKEKKKKLFITFPSITNEVIKDLGTWAPKSIALIQFFPGENPHAGRNLTTFHFKFHQL